MTDQSLWIVLAAATLTAVTTGIGALPFMFVTKVSQRVVGWATAVAAGLMLAASHGLITEAAQIGIWRALAGILIGLGLILLGSNALSRKGDVEVADLVGAGATKAFLILGIMTAHSFAEGVGVGVSFAGREGLGAFITTAIAIHNIPEGLAIALVLVPRGTPVWKAGLWAIFTSLPQPIMAVPAYLFAEWFRLFLPVGLGLAAGAMIWMVFSELISDAYERASPPSVGTATTLAFAAMLAFQAMI